jgi:hypothetical protein
MMMNSAMRHRLALARSANTAILQKVAQQECIERPQTLRRKKANEDGLVPCILQPEESSKEYRKNWARFTRLWRAYPENRSLCPGLHPGR